MAETANPTTPGMHNHFNPQRRPHDPANPRKEIDRVFGEDARIIEGLPIEVGHGCRSVEDQLVQHLMRIKKTDGNDSAWAMRDKLLVIGNINQEKFKAGLVSQGLLALAAAAGL